MIAVYDNAIRRATCSQLVSLFESNEELVGFGKTISGRLPHIKCSLDLEFSSDSFGDKWTDDLLGIETELNDSIALIFNHYLQTYDQTWVPFLFGSTGYQIQRYQKGRGYYRKHVDSNPWDGGGSDRLVAVVAYLNNVKQGGETSFPLHGIDVTPMAGRVCLFPATWTHPHQANVPFSEDKYIISTFIVSAGMMDLGEEAGTQLFDQEQ